MSAPDTEELLTERVIDDGEQKDEPSGKLKKDSFTMEHGSKLRHERMTFDHSGEIELPSVRRRNEYRKRKKEESREGKRNRPAESAITGTALLGHTALSEDEDDSAAADAVHTGEAALMTAYESRYSGKLKKHSAYSEPTLREKGRALESASKRIQKREIQRGYQSAKAGHRTAAASAGQRAAKEGKAAKKAGKETKNTFQSAGNFVRNHPMGALAAIGIIFLLVIGCSMCATCSSFFAGSGGAVTTTTITADEKEVRAAEEEYRKKEEQFLKDAEKKKEEFLKKGYKGSEVAEVEITEEPEVGHDPYELAALLTVLHGEYRANNVKKTLEKLFKLQYEMEISAEPFEEETEESTENPPDDETEETKETEKPKDRVTVTIALINHGIEENLEKMGLNEEQREQFRLLVLTKGNRPELFTDKEGQ